MTVIACDLVHCDVILINLCMKYDDTRNQCACAKVLNTILQWWCGVLWPFQWLWPLVLKTQPPNLPLPWHQLHTATQHNLLPLVTLHTVTMLITITHAPTPITTLPILTLIPIHTTITHSTVVQTPTASSARITADYDASFNTANEEFTWTIMYYTYTCKFILIVIEHTCMQWCMCEKWSLPCIMWFYSRCQCNISTCNKDTTCSYIRTHNIHHSTWNDQVQKTVREGKSLDSPAMQFRVANWLILPIHAALKRVCLTCMSSRRFYCSPIVYS